MSVYRVLVDTRKRLTGHPFAFDYAITGTVTARDFHGKCWMACVEWCDVVSYSDVGRQDFGQDDDHPHALLLTCPSLRQHNSWESWSGTAGSTLAALQSYAGYGRYGLSADLPYVRRQSLGCFMQGDRLNQSGVLSFTVLQSAAEGLEPCFEPDDIVFFGDDYSFSLVFWEVPQPQPERPVSPYYDFYKVWLSSLDRVPGSTPAEAEIPFRFSTSGSMSLGQWQMGVESCSPVKAAIDSGLVIVSETFRHTSNPSNVVGHLQRNRRADEEGYFGVRLTNKPLARDNVGVPVSASLDGVATVRISFRDAVTLERLPDGAMVSEWLVCLTFWRAGN